MINSAACNGADKQPLLLDANLGKSIALFLYTGIISLTEQNNIVLLAKILQKVLAFWLYFSKPHVM